MSFQDIIKKQIKIVKERNEIITAEEFKLLCRAENALIDEKDKIRPPGEKWHSKYRTLVGGGAIAGAMLASALTLGLYQKYRVMTDKCVQTCSNMTGVRRQKCIALCNMNGAKKTVDLIKSRRSKLSVIKDPKERAKAEKKLKQELEKWMTRYEHYRTRVSSYGTMVTQMKAKKKKGK